MTQFETTCPNEHSVKFTLEMCGRMAQCPRCSARFEIPTLDEVREMLGDQIDAELEGEFKAAEIKLKERQRAKAAKRAQLEREAAEKAKAEAQERAEAERAKAEAREKAEAERAKAEAREKAEAERAKAEAQEKAEAERAEAEKTESENEQTIQFLCPNGHELSASVKQSGKKGRCPECGAKFKVPSPDALSQLDEDMETANEADKVTNALDFLSPSSETPSDTTAETQISSGNIVTNVDISVSQKQESKENLDDQEQRETEEKLEAVGTKTPKVSFATGTEDRAFLYPNIAIGPTGEIDLGLEEAIRSIPEAVKMDPMAKFFWTLWTSEPDEDDSIELQVDVDEDESKALQAAHGIKSNLVGNSLRSAQSGKIEIQTSDGKSFYPIEFYEDRSLSPIGFFEALDEDRNPVTLVIRWENVVRIVVRK